MTMTQDTVVVKHVVVSRPSSDAADHTIMEEKEDFKPTLHDWLALGEFEKALSVDPQKGQDRRLPLLLRMLSASQPLSSIPSITQEPLPIEEDAASDPLVDQVVLRLENVAATYSAAEGVDALTSYHAPTTCRKISRLPPLKRDKRKLEWNTKDLAAVAASPLGSPRKKRRQHEIPSSGRLEEEAHRNDGVSEDDDMSVDESRDTAGSWGIMTPLKPDTSVEANEASSDSQEAMTTKCLTEIAKLVVASLEAAAEKDDDEGHQRHLLSVATDALLSEPVSTMDTMKSGVVCAYDLGATVSALMHHAPVLRHRHVANALCRAAASQAVVLIEQMGANCPSAVPCLLRGCIDAFMVATDDLKAHVLITNTAKASVRALANLSHREAIRARTVLQQSNAMVDVQLELAIEQDPIAAACSLNSHFSQYALLDRNIESPNVCRNAQVPSDRLSEVSLKSVTDSDRCKTSSLLFLLENNPRLLRNSFMCILDALGVNNGPRSPRRLSGRTIILLRALSYLMLFGGTWKSDAANDIFTLNLIERACNELVALRNEIFKHALGQGEEVPSSSENDDFCRYLVCACLATHARATFASGSGSSELTSAGGCLECIFSPHSISLQSDVFASRVAILLKTHDGARVCHFVLGILTGKLRSLVLAKSIVDGYCATCKAACSLPSVDHMVEKGISTAAALEDSSALLLFVEVTSSDERADQFIRSILNDPSECKKALTSDSLCSLLQRAAVASTATNKGAAIPHILPVQLQSLSFKIDWRKVKNRVSHPPLESQFLLALLYSLYFLEEEPSSPFAVDPRDFPLREILKLATELSERYNGTTRIETELKRLIEIMAPETCFHIDIVLVDEAKTIPEASSFVSIQAARRAHRDDLSDSIRECKHNMSNDPSGCFAERTFVYASRMLTSSDLTLTAVRALVGPPNMPLPFMTYAGLCRDPLVLFKAPLSVWRCRGLRRIALYTLSYLLKANDAIVSCASFASCVASELLMSRDAIVVRCLIMASVGNGVGKDCGKQFTDSATVAIVREIVASRVGLVAQLLQHGRSDTFVDWLIDYVPESIRDADALALLLAEHSSLSAAEKLETASAALRIAIAHGHLNESAGKILTYTALTRLVSSFFLVVGPVGVPVTALDDEDGRGSTQVCRNATFRMLRALPNVRGSREGLRNECGLVLQKLANLCKGESIMTGVSGPVASSRKKLLKDIYDAVTRAANAMGASIKL